jgi:hypothetical protein
MFGLSREQWIKIAKGASIAFLAAGLTALAEFVLSQDFGVWTPVVQMFCGVILNAVKVAAKI